MKRYWIGIVVCVSGCIVAPKPDEPSTSEEKQVQEQARLAFETWNQANANADVEASWRGMSMQLRSDWMWALLRDRSDRVTQDHLSRLQPELRDILMKWFEAHERSHPPQAELLPASILNSRWLADLYREHFTRSKDAIVAQAKVRQIKSVYVDATGVTVMTTVAGVSELYGMIYEGDGWKIQVHMPATRRRG